MKAAIILVVIQNILYFQISIQEQSERMVIHLDDNKIIDLFFERSEEAITKLSEKYGALCFKIATNILNNRLDAEECVNDTYLGLWNSIPPKRPDPLISYVCRIVRNLALTKYHSNTALKRNSIYDVTLDELENCFAFSSTVESEFDAKMTAEIIDEFLMSLDKENRIMFLRRYYYSESISDIAKLFNTSNHNVSVRLSRIREKLKKHLIKEEIFL